MSKEIKFIKNSFGIGLVETIIALSVAIVVITALVSLSVFTLRSSTKGKLLLEGSKKSNNQLELVRAFRDQQASWSNFIIAVQSCNSIDNQCHVLYDENTRVLNIDTGPQSTSPGTPNEINVGFFVTDPVGNDGVDVTDSIVRITVVVSWREGPGALKNSFIYTDVSNWRIK